MSSERLTLCSAPDIVNRMDLFPTVDESLLDPEQLARFQVRKSLIEAYVARKCMAPLLKAAGVTHFQMLRDFNRCLQYAGDGRLFGFRALLKQQHVKPYQQKPRFEPDAKPRIGKAGEFAALLERMPDVKDFLLEKLKPGSNPDAQKKISVIDLRKDMLEYLIAAGVKPNQYPFNTKWGGYRSLALFVREQIESGNLQIFEERHGKRAKTRLEVGTGKEQNILATAPFQVLQVDAHRCDFFGTVRLKTAKGARFQPIRRIWIVVVIERFSKAILGYSISFNTQINADNVLEALENAISPHPLRQLSEGMVYEDGGGFPTTVFPELVGASFALLQLDNALAHLARAVVERGRGRLGCAMNFGKIKSWCRRSDIERIFGALASAGFARVPSACGGNPEDPRFQDAMKRGARARIDYDKIVDIVETVLAAYNATASKGNDWVSPLKVLEYALRENTPPFFPMPVPVSTTTMPLSVVRETRFVRGSREEGRRPHVNLDGEVYTNALISSAWHLVDREIVLMIDERNLQTVRAFLPDGSDLGVLTVLGRWRQSPHSRRLRGQINKMVNQGLLKLGVSDDPVLAAMHLLAEQALQDHQTNPNKLSAAGADLTQMHHLTARPIPEVGVPEAPKPAPARALPIPTRRPGADVSVQADY